MTLTVTPIKPTIGATVSGVDLNQLTDSDNQAIKDALLKHQVLFFKGQNLTSESQVALARTFGELHIHPVFPTVPDVKEVIVLDSHQTDLRDNELWHTDVTFSKTPPLGCVLRAVKIPPVGGDTLWASLSSAFDALDDDTKDFLRGKTATHDIRLSFPAERFGQSQADDEKLQKAIANNPPLSHPVVRTHPETGKECLFVTEGFTSHIDGLSENESRELLDKLFAHSIKDDFVVRHKWAEGDVVIWDNRATQHKALFDYGDAHRIMHRATVIGDEPFYKEKVA
ncbi:MAG: taurine dioxygenase [Moraxella sp.]|uniref:taurine dioxygenase n=1 Tax=Moraxella sp. TaxID=479 RepID=UPI0026DD569F|nr:taurine dioxygenase [Moraxella sp.]MDO4450403.1 taurine dioxygenase [Moraxella sp.]